ncbi:MAG: tRNA (guanosine(46)-N7)-methyltransferase TrmB [Rickettsiaceae bacterium]|nr:MAG: tRNA (guanosine(46)-N7)-methyltransferase TrmB [Rickettsiaceae bacterium]
MLLNKSFSRRIGKRLSSLQQELLQSELPKFLLNETSLSITIKKYEKIIIEIGFGMGEHLINQMMINPNTLYLGIEVYMNGVANALKLAKLNNVSNFLIWPNDLDQILEIIPKKAIAGIYLLFPDPWPKHHQNKKRILNQERLTIFKEKLSTGAFLIFASDIEEYFKVAKKLIIDDSSFELLSQDFLVPHAEYIITKYHQKAIDDNRQAQFMKAKIIN